MLRGYFVYRYTLSDTFQDRGARWLSGRVSDSGARGRGFDTYRRRVVSLSKTLYSPKVLVNYPGSGGSVPTWLKIVDWDVKPQHKQTFQDLMELSVSAFRYIRICQRSSDYYPYNLLRWRSRRLETFLSWTCCIAKNVRLFHNIFCLFDGEDEVLTECSDVWSSSP